MYIGPEYYYTLKLKNIIRFSHKLLDFFLISFLIYLDNQNRLWGTVGLYLCPIVLFKRQEGLLSERIRDGRTKEVT